MLLPLILIFLTLNRRVYRSIKAFNVKNDAFDVKIHIVNVILTELRYSAAVADLLVGMVFVQPLCM